MINMERYLFTYRNVGQGLFHTGKIKNFNFVFDCGSTSPNKEQLKSCIYDYIKETSNNKIDLMVISHFDVDHINGLDMIFDAGKKVETVVIPYISLMDRFIIAINNDTEEDWYYQFLLNPVEYFIKKGVKRIIIIKGNSDTNKYASDLDNIDFNTKDFDSMMDLRKMFKDSIEEDFGYSDRVVVYNDKGSMTVCFKWIFKFFNQEIRIKREKKGAKLRFDSIEEELLYSFKNSRIILRRGNLNDEIKKAIIDKKLRDKVKKCYKKISENLNNTSLMMYYGPLGDFESEFICDQRLDMQYEMMVRCDSSNLRRVYRTNSFGHLLMGDASIKSYKEFEAFINHYDALLEHVFAVLLPHHGSSHNWNNKILDYISQNSIWISSAGFSNNFSHPGYYVVSDIITDYRRFYQCNEFKIIKIHGGIKWL